MGGSGCFIFGVYLQINMEVNLFFSAIIPLEKREDYMDALESESVEQDIEPFAIFLRRLVSENLK